MIDQEAVKSIENLHKLKIDGIITEEEFEQSKQKILFGNKPRSLAVTGGSTGSSELGEFSEWMLMPLRRYAQFEGRSSRKEFWSFQLLVVVVLAIVFALTGEDTPSFSSYGRSDPPSGLVAVIVVSLGFFVPMLAVQVRRFHDQDKSGWLALFNLVPYVGTLIVLIFMCMEGTEGENQYGPDPKLR